jgi:hypothetical protein
MNEFEAHEASYDHLHTKVRGIFFKKKIISPCFGGFGGGGQVVPFFLEDKRMKNHRLVLHAEFRIEV